MKKEYIQNYFNMDLMRFIKFFIPYIIILLLLENELIKEELAVDKVSMKFMLIFNLNIIITLFAFIPTKVKILNELNNKEEQSYILKYYFLYQTLKFSLIFLVMLFLDYQMFYFWRILGFQGAPWMVSLFLLSMTFFYTLPLFVTIKRKRQKSRWRKKHTLGLLAFALAFGIEDSNLDIVLFISYPLLISLMLIFSVKELLSVHKESF